MTDNVISKITDLLYLGSLFSTHPTIIETNNIKHIVSLGAKPCKNQDSLFFDVDDNIHQVVKMKTDVLPLSYNFINAAIERKEKVLVHCMAGQSRSASVVIYFLMKRYSMTFENAYEYVKLRRPQIHLNNGFFEMLQKIQFS